MTRHRLLAYGVSWWLQNLEQITVDKTLLEGLVSLAAKLRPHN